MRVEWNKVIRYLAYTLELLVLFMLQETPGLLQIGRASCRERV